MAKRGTVKRRSVDHEEHVARVYQGTRSKSSGASVSDPGDVRTHSELIECKYTGGPEQDRKRLEEGKELKRSSILKIFEKITTEAWQEGREPVLALREYAPESKLANREGWVDLTIRFQSEDAARAAEWVVSW